MYDNFREPPLSSHQLAVGQIKKIKNYPKCLIDVVGKVPLYFVGSLLIIYEYLKKCQSFSIICYM